MMKMNKVLVKVYVPMLEKQYEIWLPPQKRIFNIIVMITKAINELNDGYFTPKTMPTLYDKITSKPYDVRLSIKEYTIRIGSVLLLI